MRPCLLVFALIVGLAPASSFAKTFSNSYISFELPDKWNCTLEVTEWVCRPGGVTEQQQAIIILTAKEVGPSDSLPAYESHLKTPRQIIGRTGQTVTSEVLTVDQKKIGDQPWIDGFHKSSEVPNYLTRYLATTKDKIAVLVTFSAHQLYYSKYSQDFLRAIGSLRVIAPKSLGRSGGGDTGGGPFGVSTSPDLAGGELPAEGPAGGGEGGLGEKTKMVLAIAGLLAAVGVYLMLKRGKKKKR